MPDADRVRDTFAEVLAAPDFTRAGRSVGERILAVVLDAIRYVLDRWFPVLEESQTRVLSLILVILCVAVLVVWLWRWTAATAGTGPGRRRRLEPVKVGRDAAGWVAWARTEAAEGRLRSAATGLYQAVILTLESGGAVRFAEWKTPGDYALEVPATATEYGPFRAFLAHFVEVAFGPEEPTGESLDVLFRRAERLGCRT